jgi:hypothetical protein
MMFIVVRSWGNVAGPNPNGRDAGVIKLDAEEGQVSIARRGRNETAEHHSAIAVEVLDERTRIAIPAAEATPTAIWLIDICEHRAEASNCCRGIAIGTRYGEGRFGGVAPHRREQTRRAEGAEDLAVGWVAKQQANPP